MEENTHSGTAQPVLPGDHAGDHLSRAELLRHKVTGIAPPEPAEPAGCVDGEAESGKPSLDYPVVGFGSSAGGLAPIRDILGMLPVNTGMSFVFVPHLAPDLVSHLREITEQYTRMPVHAIQEGVQPLPDNVYVLQPGQLAHIQNGRFAVVHRRPDERVPQTIDHFFRSLGADLRGHAIGVVLSGADADGALGLKSIRGEGGLAIVQAPETATHSSMPRSSISADHVDMVVSPREIGVELARLAKQFRRPEVVAIEEGLQPDGEQESFHRILQMLRSASGLELRQYKPDTIRRRIARRMVLLRMESLADYVRFLQVRRDELTCLQEDVLIGVTRFFRDPGFWRALADDVLPAFFHGLPPLRPVRVWCAGCSSGEEVYSMAITLLEYVTAHGLENPLQIFGTDASDRSIDMARVAIYPESLVSELSPERLRRFFVKVDRGYQLSKRVRDVCIFARQNLCTDPPFSHIDFLTCRNVLIYFNQSLQRQVLQTFHYALESSGFLALGMSETLRDYDDWFSTVDRKNKIYGKLGTGMPGGYHLPMHRIIPPAEAAIAPAHGPDQVWSDLELQRVADRLVLARFSPPGLIVDEHFKVLQVRGQTSDYVELASGSVSWHLLRVVREGLSETVRESFDRAIAENVPVSRVANLLTTGGAEKQVQVDVLPLSQKAANNRCYMVLFRDLDGNATAAVEQHLSPDLTGDEKERLITQLREDLSSTRYHLQSLIEERDARNQELVSANEEIQSANEELQSTNEELETTKEELQSANEELQTVNEELQQRNSVLTQTGNDLNNLLTSVNIPLLMLTDDLRIRQFTPPMERLLNVRAADINRRISEIRLQLSIENIEPVLQDVLETLGTRETEVQDRDGKWHLMRIRPYRTSENKIEGLVLVLVDIDQLRNSQHGLREARDFANAIVSSVPVPVVVVATDCTIRQVNKAFGTLVRMDPRHLTATSLPDIVRLRWGLEGLKEQLEALVSSQPGTTLSLDHISTTAEHKVLRINGQVLTTDGDRIILLTMEDVTEQRDAQHLIATQKHHAEQQMEETARTLNQAQTELRELAAYLFNVQEEERQRVARELHDDIGQRLALVPFTLREARARLANGDAERAFDTATEQIEKLGADVRHLSHRLHPAILDDLGLVAALVALVDEFREREQMFATYMGNDLPDNISRTASTAIYRVTQEALRNVAKHAGKTHVKVLLERRNETLRLEVRDFGLGFDQEDVRSGRGLGLISMSERARIAGGKLTLHSTLGHGTTVAMEVPIAE